MTTAEISHFVSDVKNLGSNPVLDLVALIAGLADGEMLLVQNTPNGIEYARYQQVIEKSKK